MNLITLKLVEVAARAFFTIVVTFALPLEEAGRFGITVTLVAVFAFLIGWERYIDLQRRLVGAPDHVMDAGVIYATKLFAFNFAIFGLPFVLILALLADLGHELLIATIFILGGELIANQLYGITIVHSRYIRALTMVPLRALILALYAGAMIALAPSSLNLSQVIFVWAAASTLTSVALIGIWLWSRAPGEIRGAIAVPSGIFAQHRASLTHFGIGLLSLLALQFDRLMVGAVLTPFETGVYFRHALLVSLAYQLFNIASYNRIVKGVFAEAKIVSVSGLMRQIRPELLMVIAVGIAGMIAVLSIDWLSNGYFRRTVHLDSIVALLLLTGAILRIAADLHGMILNATMREALIFRHQFVAVLLGSIGLLLLATNFGVVGVAGATLVPASVYLLLNVLAVKGVIGAAHPPGPASPNP